jgi:hypothetical protein
MDTLVDKAWNLHRLTGHFPIETLLEATHWLEARYRKAPGDKVAVAIALHYVLLALREDATLESKRAQDYCACAARWQVIAWENERTVAQIKSLADND